MNNLPPQGFAAPESASPARVPLRARLVKGLRRSGVRGLYNKAKLMARAPLDACRKRRLLRRHGDVINALGVRIAIDSPLVQASVVEALLNESYEFREMELMRRLIDPSLPTVELGGSIGIVANVANRLLDHPERHVVVEANPSLAPILRGNRDLNGAKFEIIEAAIAYDAAAVEFTIGASSLTGSTRGNGALMVRVPTVSLRRIVESRGFGVINLIVDIEGSEVDLTRHELDVIRKHVKIFILETHECLFKDGSTDRMIDSLAGAGLRIVEGDRDGSNVLAFVNDSLVPGTPA